MNDKKELDKVNSLDIRRLEKTLHLINKEEERLLREFDRDIVKILGDSLNPILSVYERNPIKDGIGIKINNKIINVPRNFLLHFHSSYINDPKLKELYLSKLNKWFSDKTNKIKREIKNKDNYQDISKKIPESFALSSLALTSFHRRSGMYLRDVQKLAALSLSEGNVSELSTGEGKTVSAILPLYLFALRGKGSHLITANSYLANRDFEELKPIFEGLGLSVGYLPEDITEQALVEGLDPNNLTLKEKYDLQQKVFKVKRNAYRQDITYGSKSAFAFDYLRDCGIKKIGDFIQRVERPGFALIDEVDDCLIDDALTPYRIAGQSKIYNHNLSINDLAIMYDEDYQTLLDKVRKLGIKSTRLTYEEARYLTGAIFGDEILPDEDTYLEAAHNFFSFQKIAKVDNKTFDALYQPDLYDTSELQKKYGIIFSEGKRQYKITDKCMEEFLKFSYLSFQINTKAILCERQLINDKKYKNNEDYYIDEFTGRLRFTIKGAERLLLDRNYPIISDDYNKYLRNLAPETSIMTHYLNQVAVAGLIMKKDEDYALHSGKIKPVKNGRIREGSHFSNGLQQALEIKEGIPRLERTKESVTHSSITQKNFYQRYDMYAGMTGTSSKELFEEIYGKSTTRVPKSAYYEYYRKQRGSKPIEVVNKEVEFTVEAIDKYNLIISSIKNSLNTNQPVLLVVSDVSEIQSLSNLLNSYKINHQTLNLFDDKEEEAFKLAQSGLPGMVTISTDMAGRGTDIKLGGDRDTIIEILTQRHIRKLERNAKAKFNFTASEFDFLRKKVETSYMSNDLLWGRQDQEGYAKSIEKRGLKVISSGYFEIDRIDRQLEGRTGRNGLGGAIERYVSIKDLMRLGLDLKDIKSEFVKASRRKDGSLDLDERYRNSLLKQIVTKQKNNEGEIKSKIQYSQQVNEHAVQMIEDYRERRRDILSGEVSKEKQFREILNLSTDAMIAEHMDTVDGSIMNQKATNCKKLDLDSLLLEVKEVYGIRITKEILDKNNITIKGLRNALTGVAINSINYKANKEDVIAQILLAHNDFMIANIPYLIDSSQEYKGLLSITQGFTVDPLTTMRYFENKGMLDIQASKNALKRNIGSPLLQRDFYLQEQRKDSKGGYIVRKIEDEYEVEVSKEQSITEKIRKLRTLLGNKGNNVEVSGKNMEGLVESKLGRFIKLFEKNPYDGKELKKDGMKQK